MNVIIVDTPVQKISRADVGPTLTLPVIYKLIGCDCLAGYKLYGNGAKGHMFYCDDEALFKKPRPPAFLLEGYNDPVHGRILIFKTTGDGKEASPTISIEEVFSLVFFLP